MKVALSSWFSIEASNHRNVILDALRFLGVFLTLFRHTGLPPGNSFITEIFRVLHRGGWVGVDLFFVLSGFLVSNLIFQEIKKNGSFGPKNFLIRRGLKIYPSYYILLFLALLLFLFRSHYRITTPGFFSEVFFINNYFASDHGWLWSIAVEEHFYLILCLLLFFYHRKGILNTKVLLVTYLFFLTLALSFRLGNYFSDEAFDWFKMVAKSHFRFDSLFAGVLLSYIYYFNRKCIAFIFDFKWLTSMLAISFICTNFIWDISSTKWIPLVSLSLNPIFFGIILIILMEFSNSDRIKYLLRPFAFVGKYSYSIYLFHGFIGLFFIGRFGYWGGFLGYFLASFFVGIIFSKLIEYPILGMRDKYFPSKNEAKVL